MQRLFIEGFKKRKKVFAAQPNPAQPILTHTKK